MTDLSHTAKPSLFFKGGGVFCLTWNITEMNSVKLGMGYTYTSQESRVWEHSEINRADREQLAVKAGEAYQDQVPRGLTSHLGHLFWWLRSKVKLKINANVWSRITWLYSKRWLQLLHGAQTIGSKRAGETWSSWECRDCRPRRNRGTTRAEVQLVRRMTKREAVSLLVDRAFLGMGVWGEQTFNFVLNVRVRVTAQRTGLNGHETQENLEMWQVWDGNSRHPSEVLKRTKMWNLREFHTEEEHTTQPWEKGKNETGGVD